MNKENLTRQAVEGGFWGGFANFLNRIGAFILTIILARFLLPESFGLYTLTMSIVLVFMTFADLGINETLIKYFSSARNKDESTAYFQYMFKIKFVLSFILALILLLTAYPISHFLFKKPQLLFPLILSSLFIFSSTFVFFFSSFFYAVKKTKYLVKSQFIFEIVRILFVVFIFFFLSSAYYVLHIIGGLILTNIIVILFILYWVNKMVSFVFKKNNYRINKKEVLKFLSYISLVVVVGLFFTYIDTLMLGFFVSFTYIAYYKVAFSLIFGIISLFTSLCLVLLPIFTTVENKRLKRAFNKSLRFILMFIIPCTFGILALGPYIINIFYGPYYLEAKFPLYILSILLIIWVPTAVMRTLFFSKSKPKEIVKINLVALSINIILNYILISSLLKISELGAIIGAAIATIISRLFLFAYTTSLLKKKLDLDLEKKIFIKPIIAGFIMFVLIKLINYFIVKDMTLVMGILEVIFGVLIYFLIMFLIKGFTTQDFKVLQKIPIKDFYKRGEK